MVHARPYEVGSIGSQVAGLITILRPLIGPFASAMYCARFKNAVVLSFGRLKPLAMRESMPGTLATIWTSSFVTPCTGLPARREAPADVASNPPRTATKLMIATARAHLNNMDPPSSRPTPAASCKHHDPI